MNAAQCAHAHGLPPITITAEAIRLSLTNTVCLYASFAQWRRWMSRQRLGRSAIKARFLCPNTVPCSPRPPRLLHRLLKSVSSNSE